MYNKEKLKRKLEPRAHLCIFFGYNTQMKGHCLFNPNKNKVFITANIQFNKLAIAFPLISLMSNVKML